MNSNDPLTTSLFIYWMLCVTIGWINIGGTTLAIFALFREKDAIQDAAFLSLTAQAAPLGAGLLLALVTMAALAADFMPPLWSLMAFILPAFLIGPVMSLRLLGMLARASGARKKLSRKT